MNAPHDIILYLMCRSHKLLHITLTKGCAIASTCSLAGSVLPSLASVQVPPLCISAVLHGNPVEKVTVTDFGDPDVHAFHLMVSGFAFSTTLILSLHLEFDSVHGDVLRCLAEVVSNLGELKLVEKLDATQVCLNDMLRSHPQQHSQDAHHDIDHPWRHTTQWGTDLMKFCHLQRLLLCSLAAVSDDSNLVNTWAHPSLHYITLWTSLHLPQEKLHYWQRLYSKQWAMVGSAVSPTWDAFI